MLLLLIAILATIAFWHNSLGAREAANGAAQETCAATGAALLDGTAFRSMRVVRGDGGRPQLERTYLFDYSTDGATRRQGFVIVSGRRIESIGLQ